MWDRPSPFVVCWDGRRRCPPGTDETAMDFRRLLPEIRWQSRLSPASGIGSPDWFFDFVALRSVKRGRVTDDKRRSSVPLASCLYSVHGRSALRGGYAHREPGGHHQIGRASCWGGGE